MKTLKTKTETIVTYTVAGSVTAEDIAGGKKRQARSCMMQQSLRRNAKLADANYIRVTNGRVSLALWGHYWTAILNDKICATYVDFDRGRVVAPFRWRLKFVRGRKIEQRNQERINAARRARQADGRPDHKYSPRLRSDGMLAHGGQA